MLVPIFPETMLTGTRVRPEQLDPDHAAFIRKRFEEMPGVDMLYGYQDGGPDKYGHNIYLKQNFITIIKG